ncbi:uncharacterized protein BJ171DRAFT_511106 [Polychytrium aggregatum]|uniref:uncharacterized protein n=1 Tax=Polychytrium aggregatum TaxID=110093 RepID=UPI0022FF1ADC|nr:uncharacterized protein BJ171DRAFT_511106 [Polychytrium aggregatum]KAI9203196.1 hypothetical protein BJ171DRAFT_511106 [Polychytrium aggregatum]
MSALVKLDVLLPLACPAPAGETVALCAARTTAGPEFVPKRAVADGPFSAAQHRQARSHGRGWHPFIAAPVSATEKVPVSIVKDECQSRSRRKGPSEL